MWYVYMLKCADGAFYTGITRDVGRRLREHNSGTVRGSRCTRARLPVTLEYKEALPDRSSALKREAEIKKWPRKKKEELLSGNIK